ncbi:MAG TPA: glutamine-hydrolyzing carbamoyl-phosphate synthase small subunit, partial [Planctomycetota bacterium]|nr:glutamine-hydrolyzing carbamoyl-phosphate synthase small subunit [Planctomycetota bacterium]
MATPRPALLVLDDGLVFRGRACGASGERIGEIVFNTAMTGYQEILTDPSYRGQIVLMTYPLIGNYGANPEDEESRGTFLEGFVVREMCHVPSNHRSGEPLPKYLERHGVVALEGIDTRALTRRVREGGVVRGIVSTEDQDERSLLEKVKSAPGLDGVDLASSVTCDAPYDWSDGFVRLEGGARPTSDSGPRKRIVAYDFGVKRNILRGLVETGFDVSVVPAKTSAKDVLARKPDGVFLSNGPGDPAAVTHVFPTLRAIAEERVPIFGICLGHQILGHAFGATTRKMPFGHHGANHPVQDLTTGKVEITSQNHSYEVVADRSPDLEVTHRNLNDGSIEGLKHRSLPIFSVQYHPEASPGPHDALYLFERFR